MKLPWFNRERAEIKQLYDRHFAGNPIVISWDDFWRLYTLVKERRPQAILELGTGIGTGTAALVVAAGQGAKIVTVEQFEQLTSRAKEQVARVIASLPADRVPAVEYRQSDVEAAPVPGMPYLYMLAYRTLPKGTYDLVVVDGPDAFFEGGKCVLLPGGDAFRLLDDMRPGCLIYVQARRATVALWVRFLVPRYLELIHRSKNYTIFKRTSAPVTDFEDRDPLTLAKLQSGYLIDKR